MGMPIREVALVRIVGGGRELVEQVAPDPATIPAPKM
jgi:hypothetical protein